MNKLLTTITLLCFSVAANAEYITAICYEPSGIRAELIDGILEEGPDGYSNSYPTFFFNTDDPQFLIESWQAALPFPDLISRESVDEISPPNSTRSEVLLHTSDVLHAVSIQGNNSYTTTLYLTQGFGIFTRVRIMGGLFNLDPMGAVYTAKCNFSLAK